MRKKLLQINGKIRRSKIGTYPILSLADAKGESTSAASRRAKGQLIPMARNLFRNGGHSE
jgi:hypothetical protein